MYTTITQQDKKKEMRDRKKEKEMCRKEENIRLEVYIYLSLKNCIHVSIFGRDRFIVKIVVKGSISTSIIASRSLSLHQQTTSSLIMVQDVHSHTLTTISSLITVLDLHRQDYHCLILDSISMMNLLPVHYT